MIRPCPERRGSITAEELLREFEADVLLIPWQQDHPTLRHSHEHCLARWTVSGGYRATVCRNPHFDRILWHPDGGTALLNNRLIVARDGTVRARLPSVGRAFGVRWKRPLLPRPR